MFRLAAKNIVKLPNVPRLRKSLLSGRQIVHAKPFEFRSRRAAGASPIRSVAGVPIDVVTSIPVGRVNVLKIRLCISFFVGIDRNSEVVRSPLSPYYAAGTRMKEMLVDNDHVAGFSFDDMRR